MGSLHNAMSIASLIIASIFITMRQPDDLMEIHIALMRILKCSLGSELLEDVAVQSP